MKFIKKALKYLLYFILLVTAFGFIASLLFGPSDEELEAARIANEKAEIEASNKLKESFLNDGISMWAKQAVNIRKSAGVEEGFFSDNKSSVLNENQKIIASNEEENGFIKIADENGNYLGWVSKKYLMTKPYTKEEINIRKREKEKKLADEREKKNIEAQFSPWDGSHNLSVKIIKSRLRDPNSFEHNSTRYINRVDGKITVFTNFSATNLFNARITQEWIGMFDKNTGDLIEIVKDIE